MCKNYLFICLLAMIPAGVSAQLDTLFNLNRTTGHFIKGDTIWLNPVKGNARNRHTEERCFNISSYWLFVFIINHLQTIWLKRICKRLIINVENYFTSAATPLPPLFCVLK
jgi:hypothetical protein